MVSRFCIRLISKRRFLKIVQMTMKHDPIRCHVGIHVDFTSILLSHTPLVPQGSCEANQARDRLFHQWECLKCNDGHGLSVSCVRWPKWSRALIRLVCEVASTIIFSVVGTYEAMIGENRQLGPAHTYWWWAAVNGVRPFTATSRCGRTSHGSGDFWARPAKIRPFTTSTGFFFQDFTGCKLIAIHLDPPISFHIFWSSER
jgi:hypothetical protein